jgi:hypothetical protein
MAAVLTRTWFSAFSLAVSLSGQTVQSSYLIQLQIAEYNALTTRNTYLITLQYSLLPVLLIYVPLLIALRHQFKTPIKRTILLWGGFAGALLLAHLWAEDLWQQFNNIRYIEDKLRPEVTVMVGNPGIWCYEPFLNHQRGDSFQWWEWATPVVAAAVFILLVVYRRLERVNPEVVQISPRWYRCLAQTLEAGAYVICSYLVVALFFRVYQAMHLRFTMIAKNVCP